MKLISKDTNGLDIGSVGAGGKDCLAGQACGGSLLGKSTDGSGAIPFARGVAGYIGLYGTGQFDGQGSGHDFMGTVSFVSQHTGLCVYSALCEGMPLLCL